MGLINSWNWQVTKLVFKTSLFILCLGVVHSVSYGSSNIPSDLLAQGFLVENFDNQEINVVNVDESNSKTKRDASDSKGSNLTTKHFYLWTRSNAGNSSWQALNPNKLETITNSSFTPKTTFIIIHGFLGWGTESWILQMKDKLLNRSNCNVISVDWPAGTEWWLPSYYNAVGRVPYVGTDVSWLIALLVKHKNLSMKDIHFIGHSLGAHVAGLASKHFKTKVGRISGLDPAGLTFHNVPSKERLDKSDADYVDIIHTNGCYTFWKPWTDCFGINENLGHTDFWPNGGEHQPGCVSGEIGCDHELAYMYYLESINYGIDDTYFLARNCSDWSEYKDGDCPCGDEAQYMGFFANPGASGVFYLNTSLTPPFAERDSVCSPGSKTDTSSSVVLSLSCVSGSVIVVAMAVTVIFIIKRRRQKQTEVLGDDDEALINA